jgi:diketogulonate reductase-like aldo/keto reductase
MENAQIFDFELAKEDFLLLSQLNRNERFCWSSEAVR